ncbi:MAG: redoxin domain-containing protein [Microthrixaceae bacterium]
MSDADRLNPGDRAPAFHLADQHGAKHRLSEFKGSRVMIFFYPKANTDGLYHPGLCAARHSWGDRRHGHRGHKPR